MIWREAPMKLTKAFYILFASFFLIMSMVLTGLSYGAPASFWTPTSGPYGGAVSDIVLDSHGYIFAATRGGMYRSTDEGLMWTLVDSGLGNTFVNSVGVDSSGTLLAGTLGGLFISTDDGLVWSKDTAAGSPPEASRFELLPGDTILASGSYGGVYLSPDGGNRWVSPKTPFGSFNAFAMKDHGPMFVGAVFGVYVSTDAGRDWVQSDSGMPRVPATSCLALAIDSTGRIYAATTDGLYISDNNGATWAKTVGGWSSYPPSKVAVDSSGDVLAFTATGMFVSTDRGLTWTASSKGLTDFSINCLIVAPDGHVFAGTENQGFFASVDGGLSWSWRVHGMSDTYVMSMAVDSVGSLIAGTLGGIYRSGDGGKTWALQDSGLSNTAVWAVVVSPTGRIYAGTDGEGVFVSTDEGTMWKQTGLTQGWVDALSISPDGYVYAGTYGMGVYGSADSGVAWSRLQKGAQDVNIVCLATAENGNTVMGTDQGNIFQNSGDSSAWVLKTNYPGVHTLAFGNSPGTIFAGSYNGVIVSNNGGQTWSQTNDGLTNPDVLTLSSNPESYLFAGDIQGVYVSRNEGASWTSANFGGDVPQVYSVVFDSAQYAYAGTAGRGIYRSADPTLTGVSTNPNQVPESFVLSQNYPNPFNPTTNIGYRIADVGLVTLKVYNVLGELVKTLVNKVEQPGSYRVQFDGSNLASGVYFCRLQAGTFTQTRKLLLLK